METTDFKVKTEFINRDNGFVPGKLGIAIDLGYSAVKQFSPVSVIRFPSYAKRVGADFAFVDAPPKEAIFYKNNGNIIPLDEFHRDLITKTIEGSTIKHTFDKTVKSVKDTKKRNPFTPLDVAPMPPNVAPQAKPQENIEKPKPFVENTEKNTEKTKEKVQAGEGTRFVSVSQNTE